MLDLEKIDPNNHTDLYRLLNYLQYSMETPIARRQNKKACPYCAHVTGSHAPERSMIEVHDPDCKLMEVLFELHMIVMYPDATFDGKDVTEKAARIGAAVVLARQVLRDIHRLDHLGNLVIYESEKINHCPTCHRDMIKHADGEWVCHHTHIL